MNITTLVTALQRLAQCLLVGSLFVIAGNSQAVERVTYYHNDALGSPVAATDASGMVMWRESYAPYGERLIKEPASSENTAWYTGKQEESAFKMSYFGARWYDPAIGRFMAVDPVGFSPDNIQSFSKYAYANNNPYVYVDPDGNFPFLVPLAIFIAKEVAAEGFSQITGLPNLSVKGLVKKGIKGVGTLLAKSKTRKDVTKGAGDLTKTEIKQIQKVVNKAGRPLEVVGSAAKGTRRGVGSNLPVGKGAGTKSDIDVLIPPSSKGHFKGLTDKLPDADVNIGTANPHIGPSIRFEPK